MSVLIKGFEVPKDGCKDCAMVQRGKVFDTCPFLKQEVNGNVERGGKPNGCPLIEVTDTNVGDTISRQAAIDSFDGVKVDEKYCTEYDIGYNDGIDFAVSRLSVLPSAQPTLYGYSIEHLVLIARVMQKENVTPEKAIECFKDLGRIVQMIVDEQQEMIRRVVGKWMI